MTDQRLGLERLEVFGDVFLKHPVSGEGVYDLRRAIRDFNDSS